MNFKPRILTDKSGRRRMVVLSLNDYKRIMEYMEDLEDSIELRKARKTASGFIELNRLIKNLK